MSIKWMVKALDSRLPPTKKLVMVALANNASDEGLAWPSIRTLARHTSLSKRTVQRILHSFHEAGYFVIEEPATGKPGVTNLYRLLGIPDERGVIVSPLDHQTGDNDDIDGCHSLSPESLRESLRDRPGYIIRKSLRVPHSKNFRRFQPAVHSGYKIRFKDGRE